MTEIRARLRGRTSGTRAVGRRWLAPGRLLVLAALLVALTPMTLRALGQQEISFEHLVEVMPAADKFSERKGDPPVIRAFRTNQAGEPELIGFLFLTTEVPPPRIGYAAIIKVLVGMDLEGRLTGVKVLQHREPIASIIGDFFARPDFLAQFVGKSIADEFRVNRDIDRVSRATLSIRVMSEDVRDAARLVADTYVRPSVEKAAALEYYVASVGRAGIDRDDRHRRRWHGRIRGVVRPGGQ